ncbi:MAG: hypothetical protein HY916_06095 [Desulfovibrio sp.]|nr:hypothetical protein [Desulfovibrio sp.]
MTQSPRTEESASPAEDIARCEAEMAGFAAERDACVARCRELLAAEDPAKGVFHAAEIFRLQQDKLRLEVEMEFRRKKINRIRLGLCDDNVQSAGGLVF